MNTMELNSIIEQHRPLEALSSLPIAYLNNDGEVKALWFNYYLDQTDNELIIFIKSIFIMGENMELEEVKTNIQQKTKITEFDEPSLNRQEYLSSLVSQFTCYNRDEMNKLLEQAEMQPLLIAYKAVQDNMA